MIRKTISLMMLGILSLSALLAQNAKPIDVDIRLIELEDSIYIHTSWHELSGFGRVASNGLIFIKNGQAIMVDTPMDDAKTKILTEFVEDSLHARVVKLIAGHYHNDCIGGLDYLQSKGVESIANALTIVKCKELGLPVPTISFTDSLIFDFNGERVECSFFGGGHTIDNIVVYFSNRKVLFGGCLVKSPDSQNLGYTGEAVLSEWGNTINKLISNYTKVEIIIPGHGSYGGKELLTHTIELLNK